MNDYRLSILIANLWVIAGALVVNNEIAVICGILAWIAISIFEYYKQRKLFFKQSGGNA